MENQMSLETATYMNGLNPANPVKTILPLTVMIISG